MKKIISFVLVCIMILCVCISCQKDDEVVIVTPPAVKEVIVDFKSAEKFVEPVVLAEFKNDDGYTYNFSFDYRESFVQVDDNSFIVSGSKKKNNEESFCIFKVGLDGKIEWTYESPKYFFVEGILLKGDEIYVLSDSEATYYLLKLSKDGKLISEKELFEGGLKRSAILCDDSIFLIEKREPDNEDKPYIVSFVIGKFDFDGKELWRREHEKEIDFYGRRFFSYKKELYIVKRHDNEEVIITRLSSDGKDDGEVKIGQDKGNYIKLLFDGNNLLLASTEENSKDEDYIHLRKYNLDGKLVWESKGVFEEERWDIEGMYVFDNYIYVDLYTDNDEIAKAYVCKYSMDGEFVSIYDKGEVEFNY